MLWVVAVLHPLLGGERFPFGARLLSSVYCGVGMVGVWGMSYRLVVLEEEGGGEEEGGREGGKEGGGGRRSIMRLKKTE